MSFVRSVQAGELGRIPDEENRQIISDETPIALLGLELEGEASNVPQCVR